MGAGVSTEIRTVVKIFVMYSTTIRKQGKDLKSLEVLLHHNNKKRNGR